MFAAEMFAAELPVRELRRHDPVGVDIAFTAPVDVLDAAVVTTLSLHLRQSLSLAA
jgi:hypothetical protein